MPTFIISKYAAKGMFREGAKLLATAKLEIAPKAPVMNGQADSVSGYLTAFVRVGIEAIPSRWLLRKQLQHWRP